MPSKRYSKLDEIEEIDDVSEEFEEEGEAIVSDEKIEAEYEDVYLTLMKDVTLTTVGAVTGKEYVFNGAGSTLPVDSRDAAIILDRRRKTSCCGSLDSPYFEVR